jgi:hypothetical protein
MPVLRMCGAWLLFLSSAFIAWFLVKWTVSILFLPSRHFKNCYCILWYNLWVSFSRVQKLHQRWVALRSLLHSKLITPLASISFPVEERTVTRQTRTVLETRLVETNIHFRQLQECTEWCRNKLVSYYLISVCFILLWHKFDCRVVPKNIDWEQAEFATGCPCPFLHLECILSS